MMIFDDPMKFVTWFADAMQDAGRCRMDQAYEKVKQDQEQKEGE
jgi:hypothetical protein